MLVKKAFGGRVRRSRKFFWPYTYVKTKANKYENALRDDLVILLILCVYVRGVTCTNRTETPFEKDQGDIGGCMIAINIGWPP